MFLCVLCIWHCPFCADGPLAQKDKGPKKAIPVPEIRVLSAAEQVGGERLGFVPPENYIKFHLCALLVKVYICCVLMHSALQWHWCWHGPFV